MVFPPAVENPVFFLTHSCIHSFIHNPIIFPRTAVFNLQASCSFYSPTHRELSCSGTFGSASSLSSSYPAFLCMCLFQDGAALAPVQTADPICLHHWLQPWRCAILWMNGQCCQGSVTGTVTFFPSPGQPACLTAQSQSPLFFPEGAIGQIYGMWYVLDLF